MEWVRLWLDMPNDPKWRAIARRSGQRVGDVVAVYTHMLCQARKADEPGCLESWDDEDVGAALDLEAEDVAAIRNAMQGKVLDGDQLTGWDKRQPKREDNSTDRVREHRKRLKEHGQRAETEPKRDVTQRNAPDTESDTDTESERKERDANASPKKSGHGTRLPEDWTLPGEWHEWALRQGLRDPPAEAERFRDYWLSQPGQKARKADWQATWRNWVRKALEYQHGKRSSEAAPKQTSRNPYLAAVGDDFTPAGGW